MFPLLLQLSIVERESLGAPMSNTLLQHHHPIAEALVNRGLLALTAGEKQRSVLRAIQEMANWTTNAVDIPPRLKLELRVTESKCTVRSGQYPGPPHTAFAAKSTRQLFVIRTVYSCL